MPYSVHNTKLIIVFLNYEPDNDQLNVVTVRDDILISSLQI